MSKFSETLVGQKFGRLSVAEVAPSRRHQPYVRAVCDCGTDVTVNAYSLKKGITKSCGCLQREVAAALVKKNGLRWTPELRQCRKCSATFEAGNPRAAYCLGCRPAVKRERYRSWRASLSPETLAAQVERNREYRRKLTVAITVVRELGFI